MGQSGKKKIDKTRPLLKGGGTPPCPCRSGEYPTLLGWDITLIRYLICWYWFEIPLNPCCPSLFSLHKVPLCLGVSSLTMFSLLMNSCITLIKKWMGKMVLCHLNWTTVRLVIGWSELEQVTRKMGFSEFWNQKIMMCIKSVPFFILINGEPISCFITPSRGLCQ